MRRRRNFIFAGAISCVLAWGITLPAFMPAAVGGHRAAESWAHSVHETICVFDRPLRERGYRDPVRIPANTLTVATWGAVAGLLLHSLVAVCLRMKRESESGGH